MTQLRSSLSMELFLTQAKFILSQFHNNTGIYKTYKTIRVVMGNKTCDLDSAVCTLAQGLLEYSIVMQHEPTVAVVPVMNIKEKEFRLKTEVIFWLESHNIPQNLLTFRDHIDLQDMQNRDNKKLELILVDHHTLPDEDISLKSSVVKIIDHRQRDTSWPWHDVSVNIEIVGSCATLVARNILLQNCSMMDNKLSCLLRGPILVDTFNMSNKTRQTTVTDIITLYKMERHGRLTTDRTEIYNRIMKAKTDISGLTPEDLLIKDLKVISDIPIVVLPLLVKDFLAQSDAKEAIEKFSSDRNYSVIVFLGVEVDSDNIFRDVAVFHTTSHNNFGRYILEALITSREPNLNLELMIKFESVRYHIHVYKQKNLAVTRKKILPIVQQAKLLYGREQ